MKRIELSVWFIGVLNIQKIQDALKGKKIKKRKIERGML